MDLGQKLTEVWQTVRAGRQGLSEGLNAAAAALPDGILYGVGLAIPATSHDTKEKGALSGHWVKTRLNEHSRKNNNYDIKTETPTMKSIRENTADGAEMAAMVTAGGVGFVTTKVGTAAVGAIIMAPDIVETSIKSFKKGYESTQNGPGPMAH